MERIADKIVEWIKEKVNQANAKGCIIGLSGGIDSACVAVLCKKAFPKNTLGIIMPCFSNPDDLNHAKLLAEKFDIPYKIVELVEPFKSIYQEFEGKEYVETKNNLSIANIKPRLRMVTLYYHASKNNYLVAGTDNKTEAMIGYFTKYGDGGVDILPITSLLKRDVRKLAAHLGVPQEIIDKAPSAGLWLNQTDEGELGMTYNELDEILDRIDQERNLSDINQKNVEKVKQLIKNSEHKRNMPPGCKLD